jgi:RNA polymerase sigma-70 factor (ECF subfamily)
LSPSENELIKNAQAGDAEAFSLLAKQFERRIYTLAFYYTRERADAEDLAQEVWLKAYSALGQFKGEAGFYTWLRRITVNTFLNHRRTSSRSQSQRPVTFESDKDAEPDYLEDLLDHSPQRVEENYHRRLLVEKVFQALGELTSQQRLIFLLKHWEGMTYEEIANIFNCSTGTIKKSLFRAVMKLREQLGVKPAPLEYAQCGAGRNS